MRLATGPITRPRLTFQLVDDGRDKGRLWAEEVLLFRLSPYVTSDRRRDFLRTAKRLGCFVEALGMVSALASDHYVEYVVYGGIEDLHALYVERMLDVAQVERFVSTRFSVIAQGNAPAQATERKAYKDQQREMRMGKVARVLARDPAHTSDEQTHRAHVRSVPYWLFGEIGSGAYRVQLRLFNVAHVLQETHAAPLPMEEPMPERSSASRRKSRRIAMKRTKAGLPLDGSIPDNVVLSKQTPAHRCEGATPEQLRPRPPVK